MLSEKASTLAQPGPGLVQGSSPPRHNFISQNALYFFLFEKFPYQSTEIGNRVQTTSCHSSRKRNLTSRAVSRSTACWIGPLIQLPNASLLRCFSSQIVITVTASIKKLFHISIMMFISRTPTKILLINSGITPEVLRQVFLLHRYSISVYM